MLEPLPGTTPLWPRVRVKALFDDSFDADVALCTGELRRLIPDLLSALGGEVARGPADTAADQAVGVHAEPAMA